MLWFQTGSRLVPNWFHVGSIQQRWAIFGSALDIVPGGRQTQKGFFVLVHGWLVTVVFQRVICVPVRNNDHAAFKRDDILLLYEQPQVIIITPGRAGNLARTRHKTVIVAVHAQVKIKRLSADRHIHESVSVHNSKGKHPFLCHAHASLSTGNTCTAGTPKARATGRRAVQVQTARAFITW